MRADMTTQEGKLKSTGTIIGKALEPIETGAGLIKILVTLK
jgi:hypothetical protein